MDNNLKDKGRAFSARPCPPNTDIFKRLYGDKQFRYAGIDKFDLNNGIGVGVTLFTQYCSHHCKGCHNPSTWAIDGGKEFDTEVYDELFSLLGNDNIKRLTLSGGDPLDNLSFSTYISAEFKNLYPQKSLWIYTGYRLDDIYSDTKYREILSLCDVLVDGEFQQDKKDLSLRFRGSSNQRIIDMKSTFKNNQIKILEV